MAELGWFPMYVDRWINSAEISAMLPEQEGAYLRLLLIAWGDGTKPPRLDDDDRKLAVQSRLGSRWKKLGGAIREQFEAREGSLYNAKQTEVWLEQQERHAATVARASAGGRANAEKRKRSGSSTGSATSTSQEALKRTDKEVEEAVEASPNGLALPASAPMAALAREAARATAPLGDGNSRPWVASDPPADPAVTALEAEYFQRLEARTDQWAADNPDEAMELEKQTRTEMGLPHNRDLTDFQRRSLREQFLTRVRELKKWPASDEWIRLERARLATHPPGHADRAANDVQPSEAAA